jgi:hypothetical protein
MFSPVEFFRVRAPVRITLPPASTTSRAATASAVVPCAMQRSPPALVAMFPPTVERWALAGSGAKNRPWARAARSSSAVTTPGSTSASRFAASISRTRSIASRETTSPSG